MSHLCRRKKAAPVLPPVKLEGNAAHADAVVQEAWAPPEPNAVHHLFANVARENANAKFQEQVMKDEDDLDDTDILNIEVDAEDGTTLDTDGADSEGTESGK